MDAAARWAAIGQLDLKQLIQIVITWREPIVFLTLVAECVPFLSLAAPGLLVLVLAGFVGGALGPIAAARLFATALIAVFFSDLAMFSIGRSSAGRANWIRRLVGGEAALGRDLVQQRDAVLALYQFPPLSRMLFPLLLGCAGFEFRRWLRISAAGSLLFVSAFFSAGFAAARISGDATGAASAAALASAVFAVAFGGWVAALVMRLWRGRGIGN